MAEILFLQRGNYRAVDDFERFLDGQLFPFERTYHDKDNKGKKVDKKVQYMMQGGRREYKIVGYAVPDEFVNVVLNGLNVGDGEVHPWQANVAVKALRKAMGCEPIPKKKDRGTKTMGIPRAGVAIYPIGIKRDMVSTWENKETGEQFNMETGKTHHPEAGKSFTQENL